MLIEWGPLGDSGFLARFSTESEAAAWAASVSKAQWVGIVDVVPAYHSVAVFLDPWPINESDLENRLREHKPDALVEQTSRLVHLPVLYDGEDLSDVGKALGLTEDAVIAEHSRHDYQVFALGFLPGFPYAGYLPDSLSGLRRRSTPRLRVPAGSVAIVGKQTGIYPVASPGGWHLLGRTPVKLFDLAERYFPIQAGDRLRFVAISPEEYQSRLGERL